MYVDIWGAMNDTYLETFAELEAWKVLALDSSAWISGRWAGTPLPAWLLKRRENVVYTIKRWRILKRLNVLPKSRKTTFYDV